MGTYESKKFGFEGLIVCLIFLEWSWQLWTSFVC